MRRTAAALLVACSCSAAAAQEAGWHYSPLQGEGDRAALGCARGSTGTEFTCLAVRCEDDYSVGLHIYTSVAGGNAGPWRITVDEDQIDVTASADQSPYRNRIDGEVEPLLDALRNGAVAYLTPIGRPELSLNAVPLTGSLYAINQALYFCAPKAEPAPPAQ